MKIGILTYHRARNYGAQLQAIALRLALENLGHEVYYVDYFPAYHRKMYALYDESALNARSFKGKVKFIYRNILQVFPYWFKRFLKFYFFSKRYIIPYCRPLTEQYDCLVYGSDQIWRKQPYINAYNPIYFGKNTLKASFHVSYGASLVDLPHNEEDKLQFINLLSNLNSISVREYPIKEFIEKNSSYKVHVDVDPTLLISGDIWEKTFCLKRIIDENYLLLYDLQYDFGKPTFDYAEIRKIADNKGLKIIRIRAKESSLGAKEDRHTDGPWEFLSLIRYAECVFTSSFHGLVFSLLFEKQVYCSFPRNALRAKSLLSALQISQHFLEPNVLLPEELDKINYSHIAPLLEKMRLESLNYLKQLC